MISQHWVIKKGSAYASLLSQGYTVDPNAKGRKGWVLMVKEVEK